MIFIKKEVFTEVVVLRRFENKILILGRRSFGFRLALAFCFETAAKVQRRKKIILLLFGTVW